MVVVEMMMNMRRTIEKKDKIEISVVVVEKGSPVAGAAIEAAHEYLDKNQGAKVEVVKIISKKKCMKTILREII